MTETTFINATESSQIGIVHLGLGAFHRAHQAVYLERYRQASGDRGWGVCSANLRSNDALVDGLRQSGYRYHVAEYENSERVTLREIGVIEQTLFTGQNASGDWGRDLPALLARMVAADTRIVTLTVTEKGYFLGPTDGRLLQDTPQLMADLQNPKAPRTAPGIVVEALAQRRDAGLPPFAVLSCDNMPGNGERTRSAVLQFAALREAGLADWIAREGAFPSSMVDRIVPAMTDADFDRLAEFGVKDPNAVIGEAFTQWVVEDNFPQGRPTWESVDVEMVADVAPYETMKLRMLNGSHSLLAYVGCLAGIETVYDAVSQPDLAALLRRFMLTEAAPTLTMPAGADLNAYSEQLLSRFANDSLRHRLQQIAMDGSQKLPQRWLYGAAEQFARGEQVPCITLGVAAWIRYIRGEDQHGVAYTIDDPLAADLAKLHARHDDVATVVQEFLQLNAVFPESLADNREFAAAVTRAYELLESQGVAAAVADVLK